MNNNHEFYMGPSTVYYINKRFCSYEIELRRIRFNGDGKIYWFYRTSCTDNYERLAGNYTKKTAMQEIERIIEEDYKAYEPIVLERIRKAEERKRQKEEEERKRREEEERAAIEIRKKSPFERFRRLKREKQEQEKNSN